MNNQQPNPSAVQVIAEAEERVVNAIRTLRTTMDELNGVIIELKYWADQQAAATPPPEPPRLKPVENLLTVAEAAQQLGIAAARVYYEINRGRMPFVMVNKVKRVNPADYPDPLDRRDRVFRTY